MIILRILEICKNANPYDLNRLHRAMKDMDYNQLLKIIKMYSPTIRTRSLSAKNLTAALIKFSDCEYI